MDNLFIKQMDSTTKKIEVIIIEGCDLSGKSTLFDAIIKKFPGIGIKITDRPINGSPTERRKIKDYYRSILSYMNLNYQSKTLILDRFFPSEMVYSLPKRGYEAMDDDDFPDLEKVIKHRKHIILYCDPGLPTIFERLLVRGDDYVDAPALKELYIRYNTFFGKTSLNYIRLDTKKPVSELLEEIKPIIDDIANGYKPPKQLELFE